MTPETLDLEVTLRIGTRSRRLPLVALAAALHQPREPLRAILAGLVFASSPDGFPSHASGEPTEGVVGERSTIGTFPEETEETIRTNERNDGGVQGEGGHEPDGRPSAKFLAEVLDDARNLPALEQLVDGSPAWVLTAALDETLTIPAARIRRSRAAYFTAAVRRRLRSLSTSDTAAT
ncbi:MAG: hypothetical protein Q8S73_20665 [Deltaproteobacteria bacterium]|nr:hypothetical protein [Deltaproteobacteria bacterium]